MDDRDPQFIRRLTNVEPWIQRILQTVGLLAVFLGLALMAFWLIAFR
jgi:hypothetical protein